MEEGNTGPLTFQMGKELWVIHLGHSGKKTLRRGLLLEVFGMGQNEFNAYDFWTEFLIVSTVVVTLNECHC